MTTVTPVEPIFDDENFTFTLAATVGVLYSVNGVAGYAPGTYDITDIHNYGVVNVTASPASGYTFSAGSTSSWDHAYNLIMLLSPPAAPEFVDVLDDALDAVVIPEDSGVDYFIDGEAVEPGEYEATYGSPVVVNVKPARGYMWGDSYTTQWSHAFEGGSGNLIPVTPEVPVASMDANIPTFTIPSVTGVRYVVNGTEYPEGTYAGQSRLEVVAVPTAGYEIADGAESQWNFSTPLAIAPAPIQSRTFYAFQTKTGAVMGTLPLTLDGDLTHLMQDFGTASFFLPTSDPSCPPDWEDLIQQQKMSVAVEDDATGLIIWEGRITSKSRSTDGGVTFPAVSSAMYLSQRHVPDITSRTMDQTAWVSFLIAEMEKNGTGIGLKTQVTASGTNRTLSFKQHENKTYFTAINDLAKMEGGFEWIIDVAWDNPYKSKVTRTLRTGYPFIGNNVANPELAFTLPGNILDFEAEEPMGSEEFATSVVVTGDGTGVKQVRSNPKTSTALESSGIPRIEVVKNYSGIAFNSDAETMAAGISSTFYHPQWTLSLTLADDEVRLFQNINLGDTVRVTIQTDDSYINNEVWRVVALSITPEGTIRPVLSPNVAAVGKFPRIPGDPSNLTREIRDVKDTVSKTPNWASKGFEWTNPDGSGWSITPDGITGWDTEGTPFDVYDSETGSFGSDYAAVDRATVAEMESSTSEEATARTSDGYNISVLNWTGLNDLKVGDQVSIAKNKSGTHSMLTRIKQMNYDQVAFNYDYHVMDRTASWSKDKNSILSFFPTGYNSWSPIDRSFSAVNGPAADIGRRWIHMDKMFSIKKDSGTLYKVLSYDRTATTSAEVLTEIGSFTVRQGHYFQNEVYSQPRTIELLPSTARLVPDGDSHAVEAMATIRTWDEVNKAWTVNDVTLRTGSYSYEWTGTGEPPEDPGPAGFGAQMEIIYSISGDRHMFVEVAATSLNPDARGKFGQGFLHFTDSNPDDIEFVSGSGIKGYMEFEPGMLATASLNMQYAGVRLSSDGTLYFARASSESWLTPQIIIKKLGAPVFKMPFSSGTYLQPEATTAISAEPSTDLTKVQRAGLTDTYYVSTHIYSGDSENVPLRAAVIKCVNGSTSFLQEPGVIVERNSTNADARLGDPLESSDGTFIVVMDNAAQRATYLGGDTFNQKVVVHKPE